MLLTLLVSSILCTSCADFLSLMVGFSYVRYEMYEIIFLIPFYSLWALSAAAMAYEVQTNK